ncbi:MAG: hypothetical protein RL441_954, partial [Actinomycetota bacterium]
FWELSTGGGIVVGGLVGVFHALGHERRRNR